MSKNRKLSAFGDRLETRANGRRLTAVMLPYRRPIGGGERIRTVDLLLAKQALSQLSYTPEPGIICPTMVGLGRIELPTSRLSGVRSNRTELQAHYGGRDAKAAALPETRG